MGLSAYFEFGKSVKTLSEAVRNKKIMHAYIIEGDNLTDKLGLAKNFAKALLCKESPGEGCGFCRICRSIENESYEDLHHLFDERSIKNDDIERLQVELSVIPSAEGKTHIAIIESADTMTVRAQNRLLKTLEEPKANSLILLLSENSTNLLATVRSRCASIRINNAGKSPDVDAKMLRNAEKIISMVSERAFFYEIKNNLETFVKDRRGALIFLDAMQRVVREYLISGNSVIMDRAKAMQCMSFIEETRRLINGNTNFKYALRNLILKIGR